MVEYLGHIYHFLLISSVQLLIAGSIAIAVMSLMKVRGFSAHLVYSLIILMPLFCFTAILIPERTAEMVLTYANPLSGSIRDTVKSIPGSSGPSLSRDPYSTERATSPQSNQQKQTISRHRSYNPVTISLKGTIIALWLVSILVVAVRLVFRWNTVRKRLLAAALLEDHEVLDLVEKCRITAGLNDIPRIAVCDEESIPFVAGFLNPTLVLPGRLCVRHRRPELRFALLHELSHLKRRDRWWIAVEILASLFYFFHPIMQWAIRRLDEEREYLCDRYVVSVTGDKTGYASFLLDEIWKFGTHRRNVFALPFTARRSKSSRRVWAILCERRKTMRARIRDALTATIVALLLVSFVAISAIGGNTNGGGESEALPLDIPGFFRVAPYVRNIERIEIYDSDHANRAPRIIRQSNQWSYEAATGILKLGVPYDRGRETVLVYGEHIEPLILHADEDMNPSTVKLILGTRYAVPDEDFEVDDKTGTIRILKPEYCDPDIDYILSYELKKDESKTHCIITLSKTSHGDISILKRHAGYPPDFALEEYVRKGYLPIRPVIIHTTGDPYIYITDAQLRGDSLWVGVQHGDQTPYKRRWLQNGVDFLYKEETQTLILYGHVPIDTAADSLIVFGIARNR